MKPARLLQLAVTGAFALRMAAIWERLPPRMASHFDAAGRPNGWMTPTAFAVTAALTMVGVGGLLTLIPKLMRVLPVEIINVPHREYYLAPERREETLDKMDDWSAPLGLGVVLFIAFVLELALRANLGPEGFSSPAATVAIVAFAIFNVVWLVRLVRLFPRPPA